MSKRKRPPFQASPKKIKSNEFIDDSDDPDDSGVKTKKKRQATSTAESSSARVLSSASAADSGDGNLIQISAKRFVNVRVFKGRYLIDIREYWEDNSGERRPGKKGISLTIEQWENLKSVIPEIDAQIKGVPP